MRRVFQTYLRFFLRKLRVKFTLILVFIVLFVVIIYNNANSARNIQKLFNRALKPIQLRLHKNAHGVKKDWHDYSFIEHEKSRVGIGEHGIAAELDDTENKDRIDDLFKQNGYNGLLSDKISVNRSIPDIRHFGCHNKTYLSVLPTVSVVVPFYNEHLSSLMRSTHSIVNRSPKELLLEIILVDDGSDKELLQQPLDNYVAENLPKVKIVRQPERLGLIAARLAGAKVAVGEVLLFLDSHIEVNTNWLPPLLEPIAENYRTCMCPFIDKIDPTTFVYRAQDEGARGAFDWLFYYKRLPLLPESRKTPTEPFESPVMAGGLFAISAKFFWELGGYDEGLDIWGGEQYELSFKIWQCGGKMYDAPCSRVGHIYRHSPFTNPRKTDTLARNYKRVAEVWMDEYKEILYGRSKKRYERCDAGDLSKQHAIREKLQCKPFKWFMEKVAFDLEMHYPSIEPIPYAFGAIRSLGVPTLCLDTMGRSRHEEVGIFKCSPNLQEPQSFQHWQLSKFKDIRLQTGLCLDATSKGTNIPVKLINCHRMKNNQLWQYDEENQWLVNGYRKTHCLDFDAFSKKVFVNKCDKRNKNMKWEWGFFNKTALLAWDNES